MDEEERAEFVSAWDAQKNLISGMQKQIGQLLEQRGDPEFLLKVTITSSPARKCDLTQCLCYYSWQEKRKKRQPRINLNNSGINYVKIKFTLYTYLGDMKIRFGDASPRPEKLRCTMTTSHLGRG